MLTSHSKTHALQKIEKLNAIKKNILERTRNAILKSSNQRDLPVIDQQIRECQEQKPGNESLTELSERIFYLKQEISRLACFLNAALFNIMKIEHRNALTKILALSQVYLSQEETNEYLEALSEMHDETHIKAFISTLETMNSLKTTDQSSDAIKKNLIDRADFLYQEMLLAVKRMHCYQSEEKHNADLDRLNQLDDQTERLTDPVRLEVIFKKFICDQIEKRIEIFNNMHRLILCFSPEMKDEIHTLSTSIADTITLNTLDVEIRETRKKLDGVKILPVWIKEGTEILHELDSPPPHLTKFETLKNSVGNTFEFIICLEQLREASKQQKITKRYFMMDSLMKKLQSDEKIPSFEKFKLVIDQAGKSGDFSAVDSYFETLNTKIKDRETEALIKDLLSPVDPTPAANTIAAQNLSVAPHATTFPPTKSKKEKPHDEDGLELKEFNRRTRRSLSPNRPE